MPGRARLFVNLFTVVVYISVWLMYRFAYVLLAEHAVLFSCGAATLAGLNRPVVPSFSQISLKRIGGTGFLAAALSA